jgi:apolipoprotein N-acyltransferase
LTRAAEVLASQLASLAGWRRLCLVTLLGFVAALALPPLYFAPALIIAFTSLVWLLDGAETKKSAFALGWWFGFGYFAISLYWVGFALFVEADKYAWLLPFAALGLPALLAIFSGLATLTAFLVIRRFDLVGLQRVLVLAMSWTLFEWLRSVVLTGFPWNLTGYAWGASDALVQFASVVGVHGLGLLGLIIAASPATLADRAPGPPRLKRWIPVTGSIIMLLAIGTWGQIRLMQNPTTYVSGANLRLVQPAIEQKDKWRREFRHIFLEQYLQMSTQGQSQPSLLIWPETAIPYFLDRDPEIRRRLGHILAPGGLLLTGVPRTHAAPRKPGSRFEVWNSIQALNAEGDIVASYDKHHLVPFGEYVPLRSVLGMLGIERLAAGRGDFQPGPGPQTMSLPGYPAVGPQICYEAIFPGDVVSKSERPGWMLNVTNDAWFGTSAGPWQHLAIARMRAVEEGLPLVRSANSGISAIFDPYGRVTRRLGLGVSGILDGQLPSALKQAPLFARYGNISLMVLSLFVFVLALGLTLVARPGRRATSPQAKQ